MQLTLPVVALLAATVTAQGWGQNGPSAGGNQYQPPNQYQQPSQFQGSYQQGQGPPQGNQGGSWSYQTTYNQPKPATEFKTISGNEADDWRSCTNAFLLSIDRGQDGSAPACNFWECLHIQAGKWNRGGLLTAVSNVLSPICSASSAISGVGGKLPFVGGLFGQI